MRSSKPEKVLFRFNVSVQDSSLSVKDLRGRLASTTREALAEAQTKLGVIRAKTEKAGGFGGVGETAVILAFIVKALKVGAVAAGTGAAGAAGKMFFEKYLAPRLIKLDLLPSKFRRIPTPQSPRASKKTSSKKRRG
jgi:hypothetical protein